ncbi:unnamed protein product [Miscanthus lutarioriparius]|uniref:Uncharacterized protein n=1 Tax=Miscanthus lutarioriparius TaxID=422564 RepID=A0A811SJB8_9POAL|nr:unnamed protein product [Miscanthus lutarioriparius]
MWQLYDPLRDKWITLPVMPSQIRNIARFGVASVAGKLYVIGGGSDRVDPLTGDHDRIFASNEAEIYDPEAGLWEPLPDLRLAHSSACTGLVIKGPMAMVGGELYVLSNSCIMKQRGENFPDKMVSCASEFQSRIGFRMIGVGDNIYLVGE